jgi:hypothetical protein
MQMYYEENIYLHTPNSLILYNTCSTEQNKQFSIQHFIGKWSDIQNKQNPVIAIFLKEKHLKCV